VTGSLDAPETRAVIDAFWQELRAHGYVEGQIRVKVDLILAGSTAAARAAQRATNTIPIVAPTMVDPIADGFVASLARPGRNITGLTFLGRAPSPATCPSSSRRSSSLSSTSRRRRRSG